jgi:predicted amidohydrolase YtcJ
MPYCKNIMWRSRRRGAGRVAAGVTWIAALLCGAGFTAAARAAPQENADLVLRNGRIYSVDAHDRVVQALAIRDGKILATGSNQQARAWTGARTRLVDLHGKAVYPGFKDSHVHLLALGLSRLAVELEGAADFEEVLQRVERTAAGGPRGAADEWIRGTGWHEGKWRRAPPDAVNGFPVHHRLSAAVPNRPVVLERADGHALLVNARAMALMHIDAATRAPAGGQIIHDATGQPTGVFVDEAMSLIKVPPPTDTQKREAWRIAFGEALRAGVTAADEAGLEAGDVELLEHMATQQGLPMRLYVMLSGWPTLRQFDRPRLGLANGFLTIRSVKLYADGALGSRGAAMLAPYQDDPGNSGLMVTPEAELREAIAYALAHGFQVNTHAIGDRANRLMLDLYAAALRGAPRADLRWRIEHAQVLSAADIPRFGKMGVIASMQTIHATSDRPWAADRIGLARVKEGAYVWRKLLDSGARIANGTDTPVERIDPIANFHAAVTREDAQGQPPGGFDADQRMTRREALRSYTIEGAYASFADAESGSLEPGKNADLVVLSEDIMRVPPAQILQAKVLSTMVAGHFIDSGAARH